MQSPTHVRGVSCLTGGGGRGRRVGVDSEDVCARRLCGGRQAFELLPSARDHARVHVGDDVHRVCIKLLKSAQDSGHVEFGVESHLLGADGVVRIRAAQLLLDEGIDRRGDGSSRLLFGFLHDESSCGREGMEAMSYTVSYTTSFTV